MTYPRYPGAEWVPWKYNDSAGVAAFYRDLCKPQAVVLHIMAGWKRTARQWAGEGHSDASWHFTVGQDGSVMQHLDLKDGGYQAGIAASQAAAHPPTWRLWRGPALNVNWYTVGIEHEGFPGSPFTEAQEEASKKLCYWLAAVLNIPIDEDHFPPHAAIDTVNRVNDFNTPALRAEHYSYLTQEEDNPLAQLSNEAVDDLFNHPRFIERMDKIFAYQVPQLLAAAFTGGFTEAEAVKAIETAKVAIKLELASALAPGTMFEATVK